MSEGIVFKCSVDGFNKDRLGECTIKFKVPFSDISAAFKAGELTEEVLYVTVHRESDFAAMNRREQQQGGSHEIPTPSPKRGRDPGTAKRGKKSGV